MDRNFYHCKNTQFRIGSKHEFKHPATLSGRAFPGVPHWLLGMIGRSFIDSGINDYTEIAVECILSLRTNSSVLRLALRKFLDFTQAGLLVKEWMNHPRLLENRFTRP